MGLLVSALAPSMAVLVVGRFVQGAASGSAYALSLGTVAKTLSPSVRPRVLALMATSWLLPGLLGPPIGGLLADTIGWRWAFVVPIPFLVLSVLMIYPVLRDDADPDAAPAPIFRALVLMVGTALFLTGVDGRSAASGAAAAIGLVIALVGLRGIIAPGTFRARRGAPAAAICAFLLSLGFASIDSYVPLMLTGVRGMSVFRAGLTITVGACTWALGSWWQSSVVGRRSYGSVVAIGAAFFLVGIGIAYLVLHGGPIPLIYLAWAAAGFGMGAAFPTIPLAVMAGAEEGAEARELSPTLLMDTLGIALGAGLGGAAITIVTGGGGSLTTGLSFAFGIAVAATITLGALSSRIDPR